MPDMNRKGDVPNAKEVEQNEEVEQRRITLASLLLESKRYYRDGQFSNAKQNLEKAFVLYNKYVDQDPPKSVQLMFGNILEKGGNLKQALTLFNEQYLKHDSMYAFIRLGYISINLRDLSLLKLYENTYLERLHSSTISLNDRLHLQVILAYYFTFSGKDTSLVHELVQYHKGNNTVLREKLKVEDYIRWVYNLHILQFLNNTPWEESAPYIYEAEALAELHQQSEILMLIYNLMGIGLLEENVMKSTEYMIKSKDLAIKLGKKQHEMNAITNLFVFYQYLGDTSHAMELGEEAIAIGKAINSNFNEISLVKLYYLIEDYQEALKRINELKPKTRSKNLAITRVDALIFQYRIILKQGKVKKATRLWPFFEKMCQKHKDGDVLLLLKCQYSALLGQYDQTIHIATECLEHKHLSVEDRIEFFIMLLESILKSGRVEIFKRYMQSFESLVYDKGYFGYLGYVYYYKGLFELKNKSYIQARVYFIQAKSYFIKVKNLLKQKELQDHIETINQLLLEMPSNMQVEMMNLLTNNEIMFSGIRFVHSANHLEDVCKNITKVLHENLLFDAVFFQFIIDKKNTRTLYVNDKLYSEEINNDKVNAAMEKARMEKRVSQFETNSSYFHGFPILSAENEVLSIILIENQSVLTEQSLYYIEQFLQLIAPKIENVIYNELVHVDDLTNLYNRNFFMKRLKMEFQKTAIFQKDLSFIMLDIDNFSYVNNQFGHAEGDRILEKVAKAIKRSVRSGDIVGRYGGEELIVILPNTYSEIAKGIAHRILNEIRKIYVNDTYQITASLGVSSVDKDAPITAEELIDLADFAERFAKENGKNRVYCYWEIEIK
ncbi:diguanylate cyclase [Pseudoneobacillus sp. C159]